jgi:hypothetical protein
VPAGYHLLGEHARPSAGVAAPGQHCGCGCVADVYRASRRTDVAFAPLAQDEDDVRQMDRHRAAARRLRREDQAGGHIGDDDYLPSADLGAAGQSAACQPL